MRYVSIDLEMTGTDELKHDVIEFGAIIDDLCANVPVEKLPRFHTYVFKKEYTGEPGAFAMHPTILQRIDKREEGYNYTSPESLGKNFRDFLLKEGFETKRDKVVITVAGKNFGTADYAFLKYRTTFFKYVQIRHRLIDPAIFYLRPGDEAPPCLGICKERAGLEKEVKHTTLSDAEDVISLLRPYKHLFGF